MAKDVLIQELLSLRKTIATMTLSIRHLAQEDPYRCPYDLLRTIGGIGPLAAMTLLTEIIDIARFKNLDRLCSFVGLIPMKNRPVTGNITRASPSGVIRYYGLSSSSVPGWRYVPTRH